jgi:peptide/nickel transport system permease protein
MGWKSGEPVAATAPSSTAAESSLEFGSPASVRARGYREDVLHRFTRDKLAVVGGIYIVFVVLMGFVGAPIAAHILGHGPNDQFAGALDAQTVLPVGPWTHVSTQPYIGATGHFSNTLFILGGDGQLGRDEFLRLLYGAQTSLEVAVGATILAMTIGVFLGALAGFYRGWTDTVISRLTELVMAFPVFLFVIALASTAGDRLDGITFGGALAKGVVMLILIIGLFGWFFPARIIRAQVLSLREKEFVEAARMVGTGDLRIIRTHILPHLTAPIIVYSTLVIATNVLLETSLSFFGLGVRAPTPSWGNLLATAPDYYLTQPWLMVWPGATVLLAALAFNLFGDGLRDALDPRSSS